MSDDADHPRANLPRTGSNLPVTASNAALVNAHERSATLMAGEEPGSQGEVRVWMPDRRLLYRRAAELAGLMAGGVAAGFLPVWSWLISVLMTHWGPGAVWFGMALWYVFVNVWGYFIGHRVGVLPALLRTCYVTTDSAGLAVTSWRGNRACRWEDIAGCRQASPQEIWLLTRAGDKMDVNLSGYREADRVRLMSLVLEQTGMEPVSAGGWRWLIPGTRFYARPGFRRRWHGIAADTSPALPGSRRR